MYISTITLSSKGQIVLPKKVRDVLNSSILSLEVNDSNQVILSPLQNLAGSLFAYKKNTDLSFDEIRVKAWEDSMKDRW
jgi:AbrB family looped-hinge helix DNA binding protein